MKSQLLACAAVLFLSACFSDPVTSTVTTSMLTSQLEDTTDKLSASVDRATINGDYLLEKNIRRLELVAHALTGRLEKEMGTNREFVSIELAEAMTKLSELVDQAQGGVLELEDFFALDIQRIINQIPLKKDEYLIRRVDGYGVKFQGKGAYDFRLLGNAFDPGNSYTVSVNGESIDPANIYGGASSNTLRFTIPVDAINEKFSASELKRMPLNVSVTKPGASEAFFTFSSHILLLPTHPVRYRLTETTKTFKWSGEDSTKVCTKPLGPSGRNGVWTQGAMSCSVDKPNTQRFTGLKSKSTTGSHSRVDNPVFSAGNTVASSTCHNQCHDCPRTCSWVFGVESKEFYSGDFNVSLDPLSLDTVKPIVDQQSTYIPYGTYAAKLSSGHETYTFAVEYFNGKQVVLHPQKLKEYGVRLSIDSDDTAASQFKRLIVEIKDGTFES